MNAAAKTSCQLIEKTLRKSPAFKKVDEGLFVVKQGSSIVMINVIAWNPDRAVVRCVAQLVKGVTMEVPLALQLLEMNALLRFGAFAYVPAGDVIIFSHTLLGGATLERGRADHDHSRRRDHRRRIRRPHRGALRRPDDARAARRERHRALPHRARQGSLQGLRSRTESGRHDRRQGQHPRGDRQHADRQAAEGRPPRRGGHLRQVRVPEPGRLDEGPRRAQHHRGRRAARPAQARRHHRRGDQRQHRRGAGAGRGDARLQVRLRDARQDVAGEDRRRCARSARAS